MLPKVIGKFVVPGLRETLIPDGGGTPILGDRDDHDGEVKFVLGTIGDLDRAVNPIVVNRRRIEPFKDKRADNRRLKAFLYRMRGMT